MARRRKENRVTGTIAVCAQELSRYQEFTASLSELCLHMHGGQWTQKSYTGADIAFARHYAAANFEGDYLWFIDDDHGFQPDLLEKLLARKTDIIAPLVPRKHGPYSPVAVIDDKPIRLNGIQRGLREVHTTGTSGMLIHRRVFDALEPPYFRAGGAEPHRVDEDRDFCNRVREAGFKIFVDTSLIMAHFTVDAISLLEHPETGEWMAVHVGRSLAGPTFRLETLDESYLESDEDVKKALGVRELVEA